MNKTEFIKELSKRTGLEEEKCEKINEVIESTSLIGKKNKEKMINGFMIELNIDEEKANEVYDNAMELIGDSILNKIKHPFKK